VAGPRSDTRGAPAAVTVDLALHGFAEEFARRYLTYDVDQVGTGNADLRAVAGRALGDDAGRSGGDEPQRVRWTRVVQDRRRSRAAAS
jgi:hypothetical protein